MRFLMLMIPNVDDEADWAPSAEAVAVMTAYNQRLSEAGVLLALDGLHPTSKGARVTFTEAEPTVAEGPFPDTRVVGGYWLIQTQSKDEAVDWASRCPAADGDVIEVRQVYELADFPADVQAAAGDMNLTPAQET